MTISIDPSIYQNILPEIINLHGKVLEGAMKDFDIEVNWGGKWKLLNVKTSPSRKEIFKSNDIKINTNKGAFTIQKGFCDHYQPPLKIEGVGNGLHYKNKHNYEPQIYRTIVRINDTFRSRVLFDQTINLPNSGYSKYCTTLVHNKFSYKIFILNIKGDAFLWFETRSKYSSLQDYAHASMEAKILLTFLWGEHLDTESCYFSTDNSNNLNEALWYKGATEEQGPFQFKMIPVSLVDISVSSVKLKLCPLPFSYLTSNQLSQIWNQYQNNRNVVTAIEYLKLFQNAPVEMRGAIASVALETITTNITSKKKLKPPKPYGNDAWKNIKAMLIASVEQFWLRSATNRLLKLLDNRNEDAAKVIKKRIENLNSPTNREKLSTPFKAYNITLTDFEIDTLDSRNTFLHEGSILKYEELSLFTEKWKETFKTEMTLYTLTSILVLKHLGYQGPIFDWSTGEILNGITNYREI